MEVGDQRHGVIADRPRIWRNLIVLRDGSSRCGQEIHPTEKAPKESADKAVRKMRDWHSQGIPCHFITSDRDLFPEQFSHAVQVSAAVRFRRSRQPLSRGFRPSFLL
jgi:hypothetical protein